MIKDKFRFSTKGKNALIVRERKQNWEITTNQRKNNCRERIWYQNHSELEKLNIPSEMVI